MEFYKNRNKLKQAFSIKNELENIINDINKDIKYNINIDIPVKEKPVQTLIYLDKNLKEKLDY